LARNVHMFSPSVLETRFLMEVVNQNTDFPLPKMRFLGADAPLQGAIYGQSAASRGELATYWAV